MPQNFSKVGRLWKAVLSSLLATKIFKRAPQEIFSAWYMWWLHYVLLIQNFEFAGTKLFKEEFRHNTREWIVVGFRDEYSLPGRHALCLCANRRTFLYVSFFQTVYYVVQSRSFLDRFCISSVLHLLYNWDIDIYHWTLIVILCWQLPRFKIALFTTVYEKAYFVWLTLWLIIDHLAQESGWCGLCDLTEDTNLPDK